MATPAQNRAAKINADRHRTPRILSVTADPGGGSMNITFDRDMDTVLPLTVNTTFRIFVPDENLWYEFESGGYVWENPRTLALNSVTQDGEYDGDELFVRYMTGNVSAKGRAHRLLNGERCDRVEII